MKELKKWKEVMKIRLKGGKAILGSEEAPEEIQVEEVRMEKASISAMEGPETIVFGSPMTCKLVEESGKRVLLCSERE